MLFCCFNPIPWPNVPERPSAWPYPNRHFDPDWAHTYYRSQIEQLRFAEECGFDWVGLGEDHMTAYSLTPNPALIVSIVGYLTQRVKLAIMGLPLPLLNPIRAAEECATMSSLTSRGSVSRRPARSSSGLGLRQIRFPGAESTISSQLSRSGRGPSKRHTRRLFTRRIARSPALLAQRIAP